MLVLVQLGHTLFPNPFHVPLKVHLGPTINFLPLGLVFINHLRMHSLRLALDLIGGGRNVGVRNAPLPRLLLVGREFLLEFRVVTAFEIMNTLVDFGRVRFGLRPVDVLAALDGNFFLRRQAELERSVRVSV